MNDLHDDVVFTNLEFRGTIKILTFLTILSYETKIVKFKSRGSTQNFKIIITTQKVFCYTAFSSHKPVIINLDAPFDFFVLDHHFTILCDTGYW